MTAIKAFFEALPILLAAMAFMLAIRSYPLERRKTDKMVMVMICICCVLLMSAQSSWWHSVLVIRSSTGEVWANVVWTLFNTAVMGTFVLVAAGHHEKA